MAVWDVEAASLAGCVYPDFATVLRETDHCKMVGVDIPIGLTESGPRRCDLEARRLLGRKGSAVFPPPIRPMLQARTRAEADAIRRDVEQRGVGYQAFAIVGKVRQVDLLMTPALQARVVEVHPELCFRQLNGGAPVLESKRTDAGFDLRHNLLEPVLPNFDDLLASRQPSKAASDDVLDALVAVWTARRVAEDRAEWIPEDPPLDPKGLRMEMWF